MVHRAPRFTNSVLATQYSPFVFTKNSFAIILYILLACYLGATIYALTIDISIYDWVDIPLHFMGGFVAAFFFCTYFKNTLIGIMREKNFWSGLFVFISIIGFAAIIGIGWELYEWFYDIFVAIPQASLRTQGSLNDTMGDLILDLSGGVSVALLFFYNLRSKRRK